MSSEWPVKRISEIAYFLNNKRIPLKSLDRAKRQGSYPYYGASGIVDHIDDYIFDGVYLLISEDGENLRTRKTPIAFKAEGKFWVNNHAHVLSEREEGVLDYLEYYFSSLDLNAYITGAVQPKLNKASLDSIKIPFPSKETRLFINSILNSLTKKVDLNKKINQTLEQMAQSLFKSWFVDFEPVKAKITAMEAGSTLEDATLAAMTSISGKDSTALTVFAREQPEQYAELKATAELFPAAMQESELGKIPQGWSISEIGKEIDIVGGGTPSTKEPEYWENGVINWTTPKDLSGLQDKILFETERKITKKGLIKISSGLLSVDTVLMSSRAPVGYLALAKIPLAINQGYIAMKCNQDLSPEFVLQWCTANMPEIESRASGTTFAEISKKNFSPIPVLKPTKKLVVAYTLTVANIYSLIEGNARNSGTLQQLRDTLLPKLLSGEITLPEAEIWAAQTETQEA